jgi:hypothetical protein
MPNMIEYLFKPWSASINFSFILVDGRSSKNLTELSIMPTWPDAFNAVNVY